MAEQGVKSSKKSSRLNHKKQQKVEVFIDKSWQPITIDLAVTFEDRLTDPPRILKNVTAYKNQREELVSNLVAEYLKTNDFCREDASVSLWDPRKQAYIFAFNVTKEMRYMDRNISSRFVEQNLIRLKIRGKRRMIVESLVEEQRLKYEEDDVSKQNKEKKIGEVVEKVALWRKFYTGFYDEFGNYIQKPLEAAAQEVGIAKKTLDDYLLQIRNGKKYGFNFNDKVNAKIGELRAFVRDEKKKEQGK